MLNSVSFRGSYGVLPVRKPRIGAFNPVVLDKKTQLEYENFFRQERLENTRKTMLSHTKMNLDEWLSQFDSEEDRKLALKILQNYTYIDLDNARKGFRKLYKDLEDEVDIEKTKFTTLGNCKSGSMMGYLFRQANKMRSKGTVSHQFLDKTNLNQDKFITADKLSDVSYNKNLAKEGNETIAIVDDIIGDGDSLIEYFTPEVVESLKQYKNVYYMTLVKDPDGEKRVKEKFPELNIRFRTAQEIHKYDSDKNEIFTQHEKIQIKKMIEKYGEKICSELVNKYGRSKLFISFDWNTPGNTPMLFNLTTDNWQGLFQRYNGLEKQDVGTNFDFQC